MLLQITIAWLFQFSTTVQITILDDCYYNLRRVLQFMTEQTLLFGIINRLTMQKIYTTAPFTAYF